MCFETVSSIIHVTYEFYNKRPIQAVELKLSLILDGNPHVTKVLDINIIFS